MVNKYKKKPVIIEAIQYCEDSIKEIEDWSGGKVKNGCISTLEGDLFINDMDWIIKGIKGEFYPCKSDIFEATYEKC